MNFNKFNKFEKFQKFEKNQIKSAGHGFSNLDVLANIRNSASSRLDDNLYTSSNYLPVHTPMDHLNFLPRTGETTRQQTSLYIDKMTRPNTFTANFNSREIQNVNNDTKIIFNY